MKENSLNSLLSHFSQGSQATSGDSFPESREISESSFAALVRSWKHVVGVQIASVTRPAALVVHTATLVVLVSTPSWASELPSVTADLLRLLPKVDGVTVKRIDWRREPAPEPRGRRRFAPKGAA